MTFFEELQKQRWDDHRLYHHSRINQSLHLLSALTFLLAYVLVTVNPAIASILGWFVAMWLRQVGHFFFEPKTYDKVNRASHEHKEEIKIGYNLKRKVVLLVIWALTPAWLYLDPTIVGLFANHENWVGFVEHLAVLWLILALGALLFRTVHLFFLRGVQTGLAWFTKILTEPYHDIKIYWRSPLYILKGQLIDPMHHVIENEEINSDVDEPNTKFA
ncbi:MAG: DUF962 domain-containing protein [Verrucomicrobiae bacterium]|nr:DUF962 domain-containing protein [Verrucomicrobiae bacterium]